MTRVELQRCAALGWAGHRRPAGAPGPLPYRLALSRARRDPKAPEFVVNRRPPTTDGWRTNAEVRAAWRCRAGQARGAVFPWRAGSGAATAGRREPRETAARPPPEGTDKAAHTSRSRPRRWPSAGTSRSLPPLPLICITSRPSSGAERGERLRASLMRRPAP